MKFLASSLFILSISCFPASSIAAQWDKIFDVPEGLSISDGIPCGAGTGWQKCAYPEKPKEECRLDMTPGKETYFKNQKGRGVNALSRISIYWNGTLIKHRSYDDIRKPHKRRFSGFEYHLAGQKGGGTYYQFSRLDPYTAICRSPI